MPAALAVSGAAAVALLVLTAENVRSNKLRDVLVLPGLVATVGTAVGVAVATGDAGVLVGALLGAVALTLLLVVLVTTRANPGMGTAKASSVLGAGAGALGPWGWAAAVAGLVLSSVLVGLVLPRLGWPRDRRVPTGPLLVAGLAAAVAAALLRQGAT